MQESSRANELKNLGNELFLKQEYNKAIQYYTEAIEEDNTQSIFYSNRGKAYKMLKRINEAYDDSLQAIELDDKNIKAHLICGQMLCEKGKNEELKKIDMAIVRLTKARTLCAGQKKQEFEKELDFYIKKAKKLYWMKEKDMDRKSNEETVKHLNKLVGDDSILKHSEKAQVLQQIEKYLRIKVSKSIIPEFLKCQLTKELMFDPYTTPQGYSYEKSNIFNYIKLNGLIDPLTKASISDYQHIYQNVNLRQALEEFLKNNPWAFQHKEDENYLDIEF